MKIHIKNNGLRIYWIFAIVAMLAHGCKPENDVILPELAQSNLSNLTKTSVTISGNVTSDGGGKVTKGVYISTTGEPSSADRTEYGGTGTGAFSCQIDNLEPNTNYRAKVFASNEAGTTLGLTIAFKTVLDPIVITTKVAPAITMTTAISGGVITEFGSNIIAERGIVYKLTKLPTIMDNKIVYTGNEADYTCLIANLQPNTKYYVKAYATSSKGETYYGEEITVWTYAIMDQDNNGYHTVVIGNQTWTVENFKATHYRNGDEITEITDNLAWSQMTTGARCYYNNDRSSYEPVYGCLYNWYAVNDPRGFTPDGWRLPTVDEVLAMTRYLMNPGSSNNIAGGKIKEAGTSHWKEPNTGATNSSGFTALPGGDRGNTWSGEIGVFIDLTTDAAWWTSEEFSPTTGWGFYVSYNYTDLWSSVAFSKIGGLNIRLIKD